MAKKKEKEKTYKGEMTKYQAKRFLNPKSKRFWLTAAAPLLMVSGPLTEDHTVDSYSADTAEIDQTMTESMDKYVAEYLASTAVQDVYNEQVYQDRYDGDVSPELEAERNMQAAESRALRSVISNYMFDDDRMTEQQFAGYESIPNKRK